MFNLFFFFFFWTFFWKKQKLLILELYYWSILMLYYLPFGFFFFNFHFDHLPACFIFFIFIFYFLFFLMCAQFLLNNVASIIHLHTYKNLHTHIYIFSTHTRDLFYTNSKNSKYINTDTFFAHLLYLFLSVTILTLLSLFLCF